MTINGRTRTCGLIGDPVEHTMSPAIHNTLAEALSENLVYVPFHVREGGLECAVEGAYALDILGCNVTVPYKSQVIPFLKEIDPLAEKIGAVNTLVRVEGGFKGYNTDMPGLKRAMDEDGVRIEGEKVLLLGAGGVARAVAMLLSEQGVAEITILNRTRERAERLAEEVNAVVGRRLAAAMALDAYRELPAGTSPEDKYLAIQATQIGMFPNVGDAPIADPDFYDRIHTGYDLIFNPEKTRFMSLVEESGGRAFNGLKMLLYQGIIAYELWTGAGVDRRLADKAFQEMERALQNRSGMED